MTDKNFKTNSFIGAIQVGLALLTAPVSRLWYNTWGATPDEVQSALPGDDLVSRSKIGYTRAITINAPAADIWPWLAQIGQGRGGLYSYDGLENLIGCDIHSADRIIPEFQDLKVGDPVLFGPAEKNFPGQIVAVIEPERALVMYGLVNPETREVEKSVTWTFFLDEKKDGTTRLITRTRNDYGSGLGMNIMWHIIEPINFVMERKMLLGIKARVEN